LICATLSCSDTREREIQRGRERGRCREADSGWEMRSVAEDLVHLFLSLFLSLPISLSLYQSLSPPREHRVGDTSDCRTTPPSSAGGGTSTDSWALATNAIEATIQMVSAISRWILCWIDQFVQRTGQGRYLVPDERRTPQISHATRSDGAEMGANLPAVDLGPGRTAVSISLGDIHSCVILVRSGAGMEGIVYAIVLC